MYIPHVCCLFSLCHDDDHVNFKIDLTSSLFKIFVNNMHKYVHVCRGAVQTIINYNGIKITWNLVKIISKMFAELILHK